MRIFKYWKYHEKEIFVRGESLYFRVLGGSNISEADTKNDAENKIERIKEKIEGNKPELAYDVDIREEIIEEIDSKNIVTRNRYGALVLNSENLLFIDIDNAKPSFWNIFFKPKTSKKERMFADIEKTIALPKYKFFSFRLYETCNGYRLLVTNQNFEARSKETLKIMRDFYVDSIYYHLCVQQNCFRARLTPKPLRIEQKEIKVIYPNRSSEAEMKLSNWVYEYDKKSINFATCKLVKTYGNPVYNKAINYHDRISKINYNQTLA